MPNSQRGALVDVPPRRAFTSRCPFISIHSAVKLIDRYILREMVVPFLLGLAIFTSILLIIRILKLVELVVNRGVPLGQMILVFSYILPAFLELTVPMALLLAILVAFGRMSSDSEIVALRAAGISLFRLLRPVALFAGAIAVVTLWLSLTARPWGNSHLRTGLYEIVKTRAVAGIKPKVFNDEFKDLVIYVDHVQPASDLLEGVLISDTRDASLRNTVYAENGRLVTNESRHTLTLRLQNGGIYSTGRGEGFQDTRFTTYDITLDLNAALAQLRTREKDASEMTTDELRAAIVAKQAAGDPAYVERVEAARKYAIPFACLVFAALGVPLGIQPSRSVHSRGFSLSLVLIFLYYLLLTFGQNLGERGALPPLVAVWLPNAVLAGVAAVLLSRASRESASGQAPLWDRISAWWRRRPDPDAAAAR
jgi:lipopolysaccharide export system permease protein